MKTGVNLIPEISIAEVVALAERAESSGFDRCWVYDEGLATRDLYVTLAAIALTTERLEIGPGITNPYTRHPAQTAAGIASLDELSGGRAFLGVGAGGSLTLSPMGIPWRKPLTAVRETIEAARALFSGESVDFNGTHLTLQSAALNFARPDLEIWLAGRGPKMLHLGGAIADGVMLDFIYQPHLASYVDRIRTGAAESGRRSRICYSTAVVTNDDDLEFVRPHMTYRLVDAPQPVKDALGIDNAAVGRIRSAMADGLAAAAEHVRDEWVIPFVISGSDSECSEQINRLAEQHGFEEFLLPVFEMDDALGYVDRVGRLLRSG